MINFDSADFDIDLISIDDLNSDPALLHELQSLGFDDAPVAKGISNVPNKTAGTLRGGNDLKFDENLLNLSSVGLIDESSITFDEKDKEDPELLEMYESLQEGKSIPHSSNHVESPTIEISGRIEERRAETNLPETRVIGKMEPASMPQVTTAEEAEKLALQASRMGDKEEALKWYRIAKRLQNETKTPTRNALLLKERSRSLKLPSKGDRNAPSATPLQPAKVPLPTMKASGKPDPFSLLESVLLEASKSCLSDAKSLRETDAKSAVLKFQAHKVYEQELLTLYSRRSIPNAVPATFKWESIKREEVVEYIEIGENEMKLAIEGIFSIDSLLESLGAHTLSINFKFENGKDSSVDLSTPQVKYANGKALFNFQKNLPILKRSKLTQQTYARKKATLELVVHRGFWKGSTVAAVAILSLSELITHCISGGKLSLFVAEKAEDGGFKKGKAIGGFIQSTVTVRSPLAGPQKNVIEERKLVVDPWPKLEVVPPIPPAAPAAPTAPTAPAVITVQLERKTGPEISDPQQPCSLEESATGTTLPNNFNLTEKEKSDPFSVEFLESNDVLEEEISQLSASLGNPSMDEDERFDLQIRFQIISAKLQTLVMTVQSGALTFDAYLSNLKERIKKDQKIALYFKSLKTTEATSIALRVMKRIKIMQSEVVTAEENMSENASES